MLIGFELAKKNTLIMSGHRCFSAVVPKGPGGIIILTDEEYNELLAYFDVQMQIGNQWPDLTSEQVANYPNLELIFQRRTPPITCKTNRPHC